MTLKVQLTNRAMLRSDEGTEKKVWDLDLQIDDLAYADRLLLAERLFDDTFVCTGCLDEDGQVEPNLNVEGLPDLLRMEGTTSKHLIQALRQDAAVLDAERIDLAAAEAAQG